MSGDKSNCAYVSSGDDDKVNTAVDIEGNQPPPAYDDIKVRLFIHLC